MGNQNGDQLIRAAQKGGCIVRPGKGSHYVVKPPPGTVGGRSMVIPVKIKGKGTEHAIRKWLLDLGIVISLIGLTIFGLIAYFA